MNPFTDTPEAAPDTSELLAKTLDKTGTELRRAISRMGLLQSKVGDSLDPVQISGLGELYGLLNRAAGIVLELEKITPSAD